MIPLKNSPKCIACNSTTTRIYWRGKHRAIWNCECCSLLFVFPQPRVEISHNSFQTSYFADSSANPSRLDLEFDVWRRPALGRISSALKSKKNGGWLLDVGCASGALFEFFLEEKWTLYGVEPSALAYARAKARFENVFNVTLRNDYLTNVSLPTTAFDIITVLESLYYMPSPRRDLEAIQQLLKPDGLLAIEIPSFQYQKLWRTGIISYALYRDFCTLTQSHISYFSDRSLSALLTPFGFKIVERIPMPSSIYGSNLRRFVQKAYFAGTRTLFNASLHNLNLAPRTLYLCKR